MSAKPRLLDLFCGAGGAAMGYSRAGFEVVGVDIASQPHYPFEFLEGEALDILRRWNLGLRLPLFDGVAAIHASPPCQSFTQMDAANRSRRDEPWRIDLLTPTRDLLLRFDLPWVIENVQGARGKMQTTLALHGGQFGLAVHRPRLFESNVMLMSPGGAMTPSPIGVYGARPRGDATWTRNNGNMKGKSELRVARDVAEAQVAMGIDWMPEWAELREAIPPAYTEWIGAQLLASLERVA